MYFRVLETQRSQVPQTHNSTIGKRSFRYNKEERSTGGLADPSGVLDPGQRMGGGKSNWGGGRFLRVPWGGGYHLGGQVGVPQECHHFSTTDNFPDRKDPARRATHGQLRLASLPWFKPSALARNADLD